MKYLIILLFILGCTETHFILLPTKINNARIKCQNNAGVLLIDSTPEGNFKCGNNLQFGNPSIDISLQEKHIQSCERVCLNNKGLQLIEFLLKGYSYSPNPNRYKCLCNNGLYQINNL